jgi:hypothetical protein
VHALQRRFDQPYDGEEAKHEDCGQHDRRKWNEVLGESASER